MESTTAQGNSLPETFRGLLLHSASEPATVTDLPTPRLTSGTVIVQPLYSVIVHYANEIFANGNPKGYKYPLPIVPGGPCIARILAAPPDAVTMKAGQLAFVEMTHRARDDAPRPRRREHQDPARLL